MIKTQASIFKPERTFNYHPDFINWGGVVYTEETTEGKRHYTIDGVAYPSITTVLAANPIKQEILRRWRKKVGHHEATKISKHSTVRGTSLHKLCESYITEHRAEIKTYGERENFFKVKSLLDEQIGNLYCVEKALISQSLAIAGRCDLICEWGGELSVIDFKTSGKTKYVKNISEYFIQATAYARMFEDMTSIKVPRVVIIIVTEELPEPQVFVESTDTWIQPLKVAISTYQESIRNVITNQTINS